ncbi:KAP family P-loop NTPase fold protein [Flavobacterium luteolum]|uniref:KAP family P-loop NTPase fold protein n=1 Tax=Flavobacterium luteolum TaxID=3003259 RepID=UPI00248DD706|nr:P-loop NTPase fold protein [Flavobacterium luteolum]
MPNNKSILVKNSSMLLIGLALFFFIYFQNRINGLIERYLMTDPSYNTWHLQLFIALLFAAVWINLLYKMLILEYRPSKSEYFFAGTVLFLAAYYRFGLGGTGWNLHGYNAFHGYSVKYLDLVLAGVISFFLFNAARFLFSCKKITEDKNLLLGDNPISDQGSDELEYHVTAEKLSRMLLLEQHKRSISIGLIGPWGNGKSSVIEMTKRSLENSGPFKKNDLIVIHFLPYLNHSENDIINEFFTSLSNELSAYSGKLSNQITDYAGKLTDIYENKTISSFLEDQITNFSKYSANELYNNINSMLEDIDKKIVVFIDDLDRLNQSEILQTLKLIRNTANFHNTFFVVAMDKDYVVRRLTEDRNILDTKFVDKFFQLEIYLPLIDSNILKKFFIKELGRPFSPSPADFKEMIATVMNDPNLLFTDYIRNFRDAKRAVNQIKFDLTVFKEDFNYLNLKDFINFTFFKLRFPDMISQLNLNLGAYVQINQDNQTYFLKEINQEEQQENDLFLDYMDSEQINSIKHLSKYEIFEKITSDGADNQTNKSLNAVERRILMKTLAHLFGKENEIEAQSSIKYVANFQMLMEQRIFEKYLKQSEFDNLYTCSQAALKPELEKINKEKKIQQLLDRLSFLTTKDPSKLKRIVIYTVIVYEKYSTYNQFDLETFRLIDKFLQLLHQNWDIAADGDYSPWINQNIFSSDLFLPQTRLMLLSNIWELHQFNHKWHLQDDYISSKTAELYKEYLNSFKDGLWDVNNYQTYYTYDSIKDIDPAEINRVFMDFWSDNPIELLCAQMTDLSSYSNTAFNISPTAVHIFGAMSAVMEFIGGHRDSASTQIQEYLELFRLLQITGLNLYLEYDFVHSTLIKNKINYWKSIPGRDALVDEHRPLQAVLKTDNRALSLTLISNLDLDYYFQTRSFEFEGSFYLLLTINTEKTTKNLSQFIDKVLGLVNDSQPKFNEPYIQKSSIIELGEDLALEFVSIIPSEPKIKYAGYQK